MPLVLAFHGLQSNPANLRSVSGLDDVADEAGVVVAYPAAALGDWLGREAPTLGSPAVTIDLCGETVFRNGSFDLDPARERRLSEALRAASLPTRKTFPPHEERVEIVVDLGAGGETCEVLGADLSEDYVRENTSYRS